MQETEDTACTVFNRVAMIRESRVQGGMGAYPQEGNRIERAGIGGMNKRRVVGDKSIRPLTASDNTS